MLFIGIIFFIIESLAFSCRQSTLSSVERTVTAVFWVLPFSLWSIQCVGYIDHVLKSFFVHTSPVISSLKSGDTVQPKVAVFIPVFNERPDIVSNTLAATLNIQYPNFQVFLLDDSDNADIQERLAELSREFHIEYIHRTHRRGHKAGAINDAINGLSNDTKYLLILDADHCPKPNILTDLITLIERDSPVAFVQTPQYFKCDTRETIARAYSLQEHLFYKHICRGLAVNNASFMCGTNVIMRLRYLREIGGMDETCITEDLATSFIFHSNGYKSIYLDSVLAEGMPPPSLSAYFTQQMRWAYGTTQHVKKCVRTFLTRPRSLNVLQWWEYAIVSGSWYLLVGFAFLMWMIYIILVLLLGKTQLTAVPLNLPFLLFIILTGSQLVTSVRERGFRVRDLIFAHVLTCSVFPIYIQTILYGLVGKRLGFMVTPKGEMHVLQPTRLLPNVIVLALLVASVAVGIWSVATARMTNQQYIQVIIWAIWYIVILSSLFIFYFEDITKEATYPMKLGSPRASSHQSDPPNRV